MSSGATEQMDCAPYSQAARDDGRRLARNPMRIAGDAAYLRLEPSVREPAHLALIDALAPTKPLNGAH